MAARCLRASLSYRVAARRKCFMWLKKRRDAVAAGVDVVRRGSLDLPVSLGGDAGGRAVRARRLDRALRIVAAVADQSLGCRQARDQRERLVGGLPLGDAQPQRQAIPVHDRVDLRGQSPTRAARGVRRPPFLPPAACW